MTRQFLVTVQTDNSNLDTLDDQTIMDEIASNLEYEALRYGITEVTVENRTPTEKTA